MNDKSINQIAEGLEFHTLKNWRRRTDDSFSTKQ